MYQNYDQSEIYTHPQVFGLENSPILVAHIIPDMTQYGSAGASGLMFVLCFGGVWPEISETGGGGGSPDWALFLWMWYPLCS